MNRKDLRNLLSEAVSQGFTVKVSKGSHLLIYSPEGKFVATFAGTTSDRRSGKNGLAALKRSGFQPKGKRS